MKKDMLKELYKVVKTPYDEGMILPYGNARPIDVVNWVVELSDEDFEGLMKTPIIIQAKIFYSKLRKIMKGEK